MTEADAFKVVDEAFEAGDYDKALQLIDDWKDGKSIVVLKDEGDDNYGPNAGKKKRKTQSAASHTQDYGDIKPDGYSNGLQNMTNAQSAPA